VNERLTPTGVLIASWGVLGVLALVGRAIYRLTPLALEPIEQGMLHGWVLVLYITSALLNGYAEGYRGFQQRFSPRVVARAFHLARHPRLLHVLLAPMFCMALFHAPRRRLYTSWGVLIGIIIVVAVMRMLSQPWRGIIDVGVVVGLSWGSVSIVVLFLRALVAGRVPAHDSLPSL
jgi:hypothetical protein